MTAETSNARELVAKWRADSEIVAEYATTPFDLGRLAQGRVCADELEALLNAAPPPAAARGDVRYDRELIAQMLDAAEAPAFTMEEMDTQARLLREAAQAKPEARGVVDETSKLLRELRDLLASLPVDCLGSGTDANGQPYPIRDEVIDGITKQLLRTEARNVR